MDNQQVTPLELGWFCGIIDGEGCIGITRRNRPEATNGWTLKPHVQITNNDMDVIDRAVSIMTRLEIPFHISSYEASVRRRAYKNIVCAGLKRVSRFLPLVKEHLTGTKKHKAELVLEFCQSRLKDWHAAPFTPRQLQIVDMVYDKNRRGAKSLDLRDYTRSARSSKYPEWKAEDIVHAR